MVRGLIARWLTRYSVKNDCTRAEKDGDLALSSCMGGSRGRHFGLELLRAERHQLGHASEIPVGVGDHRMAYVGRECEHGLVDVDALLVPGQDPAHDERMAQIVNARC